MSAVVERVEKPVKDVKAPVSRSVCFVVPVQGRWYPIIVWDATSARDAKLKALAEVHRV